jgi:N-acetylglucosamine-6-phosphate deacetylase
MAMACRCRTIHRTSYLFTGSLLLEDYSIVIENNAISSIVPSNEIVVSPGDSIHTHYIAAPSFVDLQIYGADSRLFSACIDSDTLSSIHEYCMKGGAYFFQPTIASQSYDVIHACIDAVKQYWEKGGEGCIGLHLEGPWLNPLKKGAHIEEYIHSPSLQQVSDLLAYGKGVITMITLAPEMVSNEIVDLIHSQGIVLSAGHSDATYEQAMYAFNESCIKTVTHLYNAMSPLNHRAPGLVGAVLNHSTVFSSIVPDGYHVHFAAVQVAQATMKRRLFAITDAVTETATGPTRHHLVGNKYEVEGILSGSALTMVKCLQNLVNNASIKLLDALHMVSTTPATVAGIHMRAGAIFLDRMDANKIVFLSEDLSLNGCLF